MKITLNGNGLNWTIIILNLKHVLLTTPVLTICDQSLTLKLDYDVSQYGLGGVSSHAYPDKNGWDRLLMQVDH